MATFLLWALVICASFIASSFAAVPLSVYECSACMGMVAAHLANHPAETTVHLLNACHVAYPTATNNICSLFPANSVVNLVNGKSRDTCAAAGFCSTQAEAWKESHRARALSANQPLDVRVSKALGSRGYDKVRLSVISNHSIASPYFSYSETFKYRWQSNEGTGTNVLNTGIVSVVPGQPTKFSIEGQEISILVPKQGDGSRGVIIADPCFTSDWIFCQYAKSFDTFNRMTEFLNAVHMHDDTHFFQILGDNFYDQDGNPSSAFFNALSTRTRSKIMAAVPGNHDFWINANPALWVPKDQQGHGFFQFYGQDVIASKAMDSLPYDFSVDPDGANKGRDNLPPGSNFMFYNQVGNIAMIGFSGAHSFASQEAYLTEACQWAQYVNPAVVLLLGHWNQDGDGCDADMTVPALYDQMVAALPACSPLANKLKYFVGHKHCNIIMKPDVGFMVGALGMSDVSAEPCGGDFGFPVVDTTGGTYKVYYFQVQKKGEVDNYSSILDCVKAQGISQCYHLATAWSNVPL